MQFDSRHQVVFSVPPGKDSGVGKYQTLPLINLWIPVWSHQVIHSLCLPLLGLSACGRGQPAYQGQLPPPLSPGASQQKVQFTLRSTSTCWLPDRLSNWKSLCWCESYMMQFSVSHQVVTNDIHQVDMDSKLVPVSGYTKVSHHHSGTCSPIW